MSSTALAGLCLLFLVTLLMSSLSLAMTAEGRRARRKTRRWDEKDWIEWDQPAGSTEDKK